MVTVVMLIGIIGAITASRLFQRNDFDNRGFFELSIQAVRYAQAFAMASGCDIRVQFTATGYSLSQWINGGSCAADPGGAGLTPLVRPGGGGYSDTAPSDVSVGTALIYFDDIGRPRDANPGPGFGSLLSSSTSISVGGRTVTIAPETGFTRCTAAC